MSRAGFADNQPFPASGDQATEPPASSRMFRFLTWAALSTVIARLESGRVVGSGIDPSRGDGRGRLGFTGGEAPQARRTVIRSRRQCSVVRREGQARGYRLNGRAEVCSRFAGGHVPEFYGHIIGCRCQQLAIGREGQVRHAVRVPETYATGGR